MTDSMPKMAPRMSIEKADNGFIVKMMNDKGEKIMVCKTIEEAKSAVGEMMGGKSEKSKVESNSKRITSNGYISKK